MSIIENKVKELRTLSSDDFLALEFNTLKADKRDVTKLKNAILKGGWSFPVYVWKDNDYVIDGKGRKQAVEELIKEGHTITEIPVVDIEAKDLKEAKQKVLEVSSQYGDVTKDSFEAFTEGFDADFDTFDIKGIDEDMFIEPEEKDDEVPEVPETPKSVLGDLYELGEHRVLCGDSTKIDDVEKLMNGKKADMVFTDPPYGISHSGKGIEGKSGGNDFGEIMGDDDISIAVDSFNLSQSMFPEASLIFWGANYYCSHLPDGFGWIVWDKEREGDTFSGAELAFVNKGVRLDVFKHRWHGMIKASEMGEKRVHPTQKPIMLAEWCFQNYGEPNLIMDLFLGSGSTLIAAQKTGRKCYGMELDPKYTDVIVQRYVDYTGNTTIKRNGVEEEWEVTVK